MKTDRLIKVTYKQVEIPAEELQQRLDDAFNLLFRETMRTFNNEVVEKRMTSVSNYNNFIQNNN